MFRSDAEGGAFAAWWPAVESIGRLTSTASPWVARPRRGFLTRRAIKSMLRQALFPRHRPSLSGNFSPRFLGEALSRIG